MNNPFYYKPDELCEEAFRKLTAKLETLKSSKEPREIEFCNELEAGKMLGVMIAEDSGGLRHTLYAFSGQAGALGFHFPGFVNPVFDYLQPDGFFKMHEKEISWQNEEIRKFEESIIVSAKNEYEKEKGALDAQISAYKEKCRLSKLKRKRQREADLNNEQQEALIRQSQYEKAELHRMKKHAELHLGPYRNRLTEAYTLLQNMKEKRRRDSEKLQSRLFAQFRFLNALGERKSLNEIFADTSMHIPPSGAGECCAPKLLQEAYLRGWQPISMAEYWYGKPKNGELRIHGMHYPACRGKCRPILTWMLQGLEVEPTLKKNIHLAASAELEIIFENEWFCVINKPSGMLSVPGNCNDISLQERLVAKYGESRDVRMAHRLDMDTSGLIIATFGQIAYKTMQALFARQKVSKCYIAELYGDYRHNGLERCGCIKLPISSDFLDRPRQRIDHENGKTATTEYEFLSTDGNFSRVAFYPLTGRTHQLRVHAASHEGLGMSIVGDPLYSNQSGNHDNSRNVQRLLLHARKLEFTFPLDNRHYYFEMPEPF